MAAQKEEGRMPWAEIITGLIFGLVLVWVCFAVAPGISSNLWRAIVRWATGISGLLLVFGGVLLFWVAREAAKETRGKAVGGQAPLEPAGIKAAAQHPNQDTLIETGSGTSGANDAHVAKWKEGADAWGEWTEQNPDIHPNLSGADLRSTNLAGVDLKSVDLHGADLSGADLSLVHFTSTNLNGAKLVCADLSFSHHLHTELKGADLSSADLNHAVMSTVDLSGAYLQAANLSEADLSTASLTGANLSRANLSDANLSQADCRDANLSGADLRGANLYMTFYNKRTVWPAGFVPAGAVSEDGLT